MEPINKVKGSTGTTFIRAKMKQKKKKTPTAREGLLKEEVTKVSEKEAYMDYSGGTF